MKTPKSIKILSLLLLGFPLLLSNAPAPVYYAEEVYNYSDFKIENVEQKDNYLALTIDNYGDAFIENYYLGDLHIFYLDDNTSDLEELVIPTFENYISIYPGETTTLTTSLSGQTLNLKAENILHSHFEIAEIYLSEIVDVNSNYTYTISTSNDTNTITFEINIPNYYNYYDVYTASVGFYYYDIEAQSLEYNVAKAKEYISSRHLTLEKTIEGSISNSTIIFDNLTLYLKTDINSPYYRNREEKEIVGLTTLFVVLSLVILTPIFVYFVVNRRNKDKK